MGNVHGSERRRGSHTRWPAWATDALLGAAVTVIVAAVMSAGYGGRNDPDGLAYIWTIGLGALMLARRRYPGLVVTISVLGLFAYYTAGYPAIGVAVPIAAALYSAAEFGRMLWGVVAAIVALLVSVMFRLADGQAVSLVIGYELAGHAFLMAGALALGDSIRSRREVVTLVAERAKRESDEHARAERLAVARDLHDSIGHGVSVISLHADVAGEALAAQDSGQAARALRHVTSAARSTMADLRETVAVLRAPRERSAGELAHLERVIPADSPIAFTADIRDPSGVPTAVQATAFRIVQEAVTNVLKHSTATRARVEVAREGSNLRIDVSDNGGAPDVGVAESHGIAGMRERAASVGGELAIRSTPNSFAVTALLPIGGGE
ncbi:signal transduction histidine kinase [Paramicrobacterium agarici]|uniref:histidine kinase n=1 Tax=Paramicrobacterium agarici TaxID=630514 RepID=A0A2A9DRN5_9MICO|nr:signal transduction histidine kinase [Microbacterium agarici]